MSAVTQRAVATAHVTPTLGRDGREGYLFRSCVDRSNNSVASSNCHAPNGCGRGEQLVRSRAVGVLSDCEVFLTAAHLVRFYSPHRLDKSQRTEIDARSQLCLTDAETACSSGRSLAAEIDATACSKQIAK